MRKPMGKMRLQNGPEVQFNNIDIQCFIRFYMILVNNLCDFHDLYSYFTPCNVCDVFQQAKSRHFIYFIYQEIQPYPRQRSVSIIATHIWIFCVAWSQWRHQLSQSRRFRRDLFQLWSSLKQLLCIIHALGEWEVYRRKCFFEFFWCWDLYPSGRFVLQVSRLQKTGVELGHAKMFRALQTTGKFRIPRRPWDAHDREANAGQRLCKNKNKHR